LPAVTVKIRFLYLDVAPCSMVNIYLRFEGVWCCLLQCVCEWFWWVLRSKLLSCLSTMPRRDRGTWKYISTSSYLHL